MTQEWMRFILRGKLVPISTEPLADSIAQLPDFGIETFEQSAPRLRPSAKRLAQRVRTRLVKQPHPLGDSGDRLLVEVKLVWSQQPWLLMQPSGPGIFVEPPEQPL